MRTKTWNNTIFTQIPDGGDVNWPLLTNFLVALADNAQTTNFQKSAIRVATTSPVTVVATSDHVVVTKLAAPGAVSVNLPAGSNGQEFTIVDGTGDAGANNITINRAGGDTINGATTYVISSNRGCVKLKYSAAETDWKVVEGFIDAISAVTPSSTNQFTNKDYDGATATNASRMTAPKQTRANLSTLTRKEGTFFYDTDEDVMKVDDGTRLHAMSVRNPLTVENYALTASVASSALTIALKTQAGDDPSISSPVRVPFRNVDISLGSYTIENHTAAESLVISSGSTLGHGSGKAEYIYIYLIKTASGMALAASSSLFNENALQSSTAEGGAGAADSATVLYSAAAQTSKQVRLIGKMLSTQTTAGTWATVPSEISLINSGLLCAPTAMDNADATRAGLKEYLHGTTYNNGVAPTVTLTAGGGTLSSVQRAAFVPYLTQGGVWRMRFNISVTLSATARTSVNLTVNGATSVSGPTQAVAGGPVAAVAHSSYWQSNASIIETGTASTSDQTWQYSGDIALASKPTWAY